MNRMRVDTNGEIQLDTEMLDYLDLQKGEDVIFFEMDGYIIIANAARPDYRIMLYKPETPSLRLGMRI